MMALRLTPFDQQFDNLTDNLVKWSNQRDAGEAGDVPRGTRGDLDILCVEVDEDR